jgi:hypothetical protein
MSKTTGTASPSGDRRHKPRRPKVTDNGAAPACGEPTAGPEPQSSATIDLGLLLYERAALQPDDG